MSNKSELGHRIPMPKGMETLAFVKKRKKNRTKNKLAARARKKNR